MNGHGPALLVIPEGKTSFEAYKPILNPRWREHEEPKPEIYMDLTPRGITFEGFYDWMVVSRAFAENEWKKAQPWNPPTSKILGPNESWTVGFQFVVTDSIRSIETALAENHRPVAVGIPGYVLPKDIRAQLFLRYPEPVKSIDIEPAGAIEVQRKGEASNPAFTEYSLTAKQWGRARLTVTYADGLRQSIHYFVMKPQSEAVADMGRFLTHERWFEEPKDPFHRAPSVMTYDRELNQIVTQDSRVWIAGLSDEGGAGSWLAAVMKEYVEPDSEGVAKENVQGCMGIQRMKFALRASEVECSKRLMNKHRPGGGADDPGNRNASAVCVEAIPTLSAHHRIGRASTIKLRTSFAEAQQWRLSSGDRKRSSLGFNLDALNLSALFI